MRLPRKQQVPAGSCEKVKIEFVIATVVNENIGAMGSDAMLQHRKPLFFSATAVLKNNKHTPE